MPRLNNKYFALFTTGAAALAAQVIFLRELIAVFGGNELIYGLLLMIWLFAYAAGAFCFGRLADKIGDKRSAFVLAQTAVMICLPLMLFLTRTIKIIFGLQAGSLAALPTIIIAAAIVLFPVTAVLGFQFALGSALLAAGAGGIGLAYLLEAGGSVVGGLLLGLVLLNYLGSFQIAILLILLLAASGLILRPQKWVWLLAGSALVLALISPGLDRLSNQLAWPGQVLAASVDSAYGKIDVTKSQNELNYYLNGSLLFSTADRPLAEEFIGLAMVLLPKDPGSVLLIGGGFGGAINELLRYPVRQLDYLEPDPRLLRLAPQSYPPAVRLIPEDGIHYIKRTRERYDLVLIDLPDPQSALLNRFYTKEFYQNCKKILKADGLLAFKLSGSADFMGEETRRLNASIYKTASQVFGRVAVIPGSSNYFFAGEQEPRPEPKRLRAGEYFKLPALRLELSGEKIAYVNRAVAFSEKTAINTNARPISYFQALLLWSSYFDPATKDFLYAVLRLNIVPLLAALVLFFLSVKLFKPLRLPVMAATVGLAGLSAQLLIMLAFQAQFGYLYQALALLTAAFMAGLALGSYLVIRPDKRISSAGLPLLLGLLALVLFILTMSTQYILPVSLFLLFSLLAGSLAGAFFPLAVKAGEKQFRGTGNLAGKLYGADLLGSAIAAVLAGLYFIPVFGTLITGLVVCAALLLSILLVKNAG